MDEDKKTTGGDTVDEFLSRYRKIVRHTETVRTFRASSAAQTDNSADSAPEEEENKPQASDRTMEIDPRATFNPVTQRQIITKKAATLSDSGTEVMKKGYTARFEPEPELSVQRGSDGRTKEFDISSAKSQSDTVTGQQTFSSLFTSDGMRGVKRSIKISAPEPEDNDDAATGDDYLMTGDDIASLYNEISAQGELSFGKSEKLRAIARTAGDDRESELEDQLSFPGFETANEKIDEEKLETDVKKNRLRRVRDFMQRGGVEKPEDSDISEDVLITNISDEEIIRREKNAAFKKLQGELSRFVKTHDSEGEDPGIEYNSPHDTKAVNSFILSGKRRAGIGLLLSFVIGVILLIMSIVGENTQSGFFSGNIKLYASVNFFMSLVVFAVCAFDMRKCFASLKHKRFSSGLSIYAVFLLSLIQTGLIWGYPDALNSSVPMLAPAAVLLLLPLYGGRYIIYNNIRLCFNLFSSKDVLNVLRSFGDGGLAREMVSGLRTPGGSDVKYTAKAKAVSGFMRCAVNAVPDDRYSDAVSFASLCASVIIGIISGIVKRNALVGVTAASAVLITAVPVSYVFIAALPLFKENLKLNDKKACIPSYSVAGNISDSTAVIFSASDIVDQSACSIHGIKTFGSANAQTAVIYAAALVAKAHTPLEGIFMQAVSREDIESVATEDVVYEEKLGLSSWIDNKRVLFGSEDLMRHHNIPLPSGDCEIYTEGNRKLIFLAVNDRLQAMFVVSYHIRRNVSLFLKELTKRGMAILVDTVDQNITEEFLERKCRLPADSVRVIGVRVGEYYRSVAQSVEEVVPVGGLHSGRINSQSSLIASSFRLAGRRRIAAVGVYAGAVIGAALAGVLAFCGGLTLIGSWQIMLFRLFWLAFGLITPAFIKK